MKLAWLTDIHPNFVGRNAVEGLCTSINMSGTDAVLISGDITTSCEFSKMARLYTS